MDEDPQILNTTPKAILAEIEALKARVERLEHGSSTLASETADLRRELDRRTGSGLDAPGVTRI